MAHELVVGAVDRGEGEGGAGDLERPQGQHAVDGERPSGGVRLAEPVTQPFALLGRQRGDVGAQGGGVDFVERRPVVRSLPRFRPLGRGLRRERFDVGLVERDDELGLRFDHEAFHGR